MRSYPILLVLAFAFVVIASRDPVAMNEQSTPATVSTVGEGGSIEDKTANSKVDFEERGVLSSLTTKLSQTKANIKYNFQFGKTGDSRVKYILNSKMSDEAKATYLSKLDMAPEDIAKSLGIAKVSGTSISHPNYKLYAAAEYKINIRMIKSLVEKQTETSILWKKLGLPTSQKLYSMDDLQKLKIDNPNLEIYIRYVTKYEKAFVKFDTRYKNLIRNFGKSDETIPSPELMTMIKTDWEKKIRYPMEGLARVDMWAKTGKSKDYVKTMLGLNSGNVRGGMNSSPNYRFYQQFLEATGKQS